MKILLKILLFSIHFLVLLHSVSSENKTEKLNQSQIVNIQLEALTESLVNMKVFQFQQLFDQKRVSLDTVFQPNFLFPNNVFASMGDSEFKNSLKIFTIFEPTTISNTSIQALVTIRYRMNNQEHKMEKEVVIEKDGKSPTGYCFTGFKSV